MANPSSFWTQANALLRKNLTFQKRNVKTNIRLVLFPVILCVLLSLLQSFIDSATQQQAKTTTEEQCDGCVCAYDRTIGATCPASEKLCGPQYLESGESDTCPLPNPPEWPPLLQIPFYRAQQDKSCIVNDTCPVTMLFTANNQSFARMLFGNMFPGALSINESDIMASLAAMVLGTKATMEPSIFVDPAFSFSSNMSIYYLQQDRCMENSSFSFDFSRGASKYNLTQDQEVRCIQGLSLWRNSSSDINDELYRAYQRGNTEEQIIEIASAFDFLNSNKDIFNISIWYNSTLKYTDDDGSGPFKMMRVPRSVNMISNAYLQFLLGSGTKMLFEFLKEMPKSETTIRIDITSVLGGLFFTWVILQLFPVVLTSLVYEKQQKLRIMMKMHGLGDGPYWMISYGYFLAISVIYMVCYVLFGSLCGLKFFTVNDYSIQFVFYFIYINLQISMAFLVAGMFSNVKTATVTAYIVVFGTGLLAGFLFQDFVENELFPRGWIIIMELYPGFALYRGLYEFAQFAMDGNSSGADGMRWQDLNDGTNGMKEILIIMLFEWKIVLLAAYCIDQVFSSGKSPLFLLKGFQKKPFSSFHKLTIKSQGSNVLAEMEKSDIIQEREKVEQLLLEPTMNHAIVCDNLKKVYPGKDGNPEKLAVRGLSLVVPQGECFGMLGPNGAGKTSFISMMIGLTKPTSGAAFVQGMDIRTHMNGIYTNMGVCPQHDLLWESLTGREHLLFYGRLKNLKGSALTQAVEGSLKSLNLFHGGVADKRVGKYSGGMKRRLSVAISLIGNPGVVYMDEPSTGLDPASRKRLWNVLRSARKDCAIILTTHSMEEAEALCDRLGIFVNGSLQCIGNPKELKARYGGTYVFTMTTSSDHERDVENIVQHLTPNANKIYHLSGTQKFELPKAEVRIADVFQAAEFAKRNFTVSAWGLADTTMEDVFIKVARGAQAFETLS